MIRSKWSLILVIFRTSFVTEQVCLWFAPEHFVYPRILIGFVTLQSLGRGLPLEHGGIERCPNLDLWPLSLLTLLLLEVWRCCLLVLLMISRLILASLSSISITLLGPLIVVEVWLTHTPAVRFGEKPEAKTFESPSFWEGAFKKCQQVPHVAEYSYVGRRRNEGSATIVR